MIDLYLHAPTHEALVADLAPLGLVVETEDGRGLDVATASPRHGAGRLGPVLARPAVVDADGGQVEPEAFLPGVYVVLRCLDDSLAVAVHQAAFPNGTAVVDRPEYAPVLAGGADQDIDAVKAAACAVIDAEAERRRLLVLTPGDGQTLEYQHTADDAARADAAPDPLTPAAYPFLVAEQTALSRVGVVLTLRQVVDLVVYQRATWLAYGAAVKAARRGGKLAIDEAATPLDVAVVLAGVVWPDLGEM